MKVSEFLQKAKINLAKPFKYVDQHLHARKLSDVPLASAKPLLNRWWSRKFFTLASLQMKLSRSIAIAILVAAAVIVGNGVSAQIAPANPSNLASLRTVSVAQPDNIGDFIKDKTATIALGKALFWDMQLGSDGFTSCASCHFHAGVDNRSKNQISPGLLRVNGDRRANPDGRFDLGGAPNYQLKSTDFPFHKLSDPNNRDSTVLADTNDVSSSQGVFLSKFKAVINGSSEENVAFQPDPVFNVGDIEVRRVEPRNTPSVINAVFNFRNFWDGRAQNDFNGVNPFGSRDPNAFVLKKINNNLEKVKISLKNSSLASQAVGPPLSFFEMSADERTFPDIGVKFNKNKKRAQLGQRIDRLRPLAKQVVHPEDSVLGRLSRNPEKGLNVSNYESMIKTAFKPEWWNSNLAIRIAENGELSFFQPKNQSLSNDEFRQIEYNFSLFFGLAIQAYEATLISDQTPFDKYMEGNANALTDQQKRGLQIFQNKGKCINCHGGPEFTNASVANVKNQPLERMPMAQGVAVYDNGFYNIAVRPTLEDLGIGGNDPFGKPLSLSRLEQQAGSPFPVVPGDDGVPTKALDPNERVAVDGAFKTPGLRNIELTAPYFHNGGQLTLKQVVEFYNRGGDFHNQNITNLDPDIENLGLTNQEQEDLVAFMKALTDERVRYDKAPFDHPQLFISDGQQGNEQVVQDDGTGKARDKILELSAVGRSGGSGTPNFLEVTTRTTTSPVTPPLVGGGYTQADCSAGTTFVPLPGGYMCQ
ncbi:MAG TPA: cytochrome c peroxidase [Coleofasciculaceae cyanobacterium]